MPKLRLRISRSLDGFVAGPDQSVKNPLGVGGMRLHDWAFPLAVWRKMHGMPGGEVNESSRVVEESLHNIGATIMGRNMFGGHPGPWKAKTPWNGERLFAGLGDDLHGLELVRTVAASKVTHLKFRKK